MQITDIPVKFALPFADQAGLGYIRTIPLDPTGTLGQASLKEGFPVANFTPVSAGGVPPFGQDFNGLLNQSTAWNQWQATGVFPPYDATFQTAIAGYPKGSCVGSLVQFGLVWLSLVDDNVTNPDTGGAGWYRYFQTITSNTDLYVNGSTGSNSSDGLTPSTALATIQAAVNRAFGFPPSQYTITIHVADGTYSEAVSTPYFGGPNLVITGNASTPANVLVSSGSSRPFQINGPNTVTINNLRIQNTAGTDNYGFWATTGSTLFTNNTESGAINGPVFVATGATLYPGTHKFAGNCGGFFYAAIGGLVNLSTGVTYTVSSAIAVTLTAQASQCGTLKVSATPPTFVNPGNVTGTRYSANLNGVIFTQGQGTSFFPGTVAGSTSSGGQYA